MAHGSAGFRANDIPLSHRALRIELPQDLLIRLTAARPHRLVSPRTLGRSGDHGAVHLLYAVLQRIPLMTRNARDFAALHELVLGAAMFSRRNLNTSAALGELLSQSKDRLRDQAWPREI
jgi:hypothetical protein